MKTLNTLDSRPSGSTLPGLLRPALTGLLALAIPLGLPASAIADNSRSTFVVVSGEQRVRDRAQVCFRLDGDERGDERLLVRVRFSGDVPEGSLEVDGESGPSFNDTTETFGFLVGARGVHRLTLDLRESVSIEWLSLVASDSDIEQASCSSYDDDPARRATADGTSADSVDRFEQPSHARDDGYHGRLIVPAGTELELGLDRTVSTQTHRVGQEVDTHLTTAVIVDGHAALPRGTRVLGKVSESQKAGRFGRARLRLSFDRAILADGSSLALSGSVRRLGKSSGGRQAAVIAGSAVGGALAGDALGVDPLIGAVVGGGVATGAIAAKPGKPVVLPADTILIIRLDDSITVPRSRKR